MDDYFVPITWAEIEALGQKGIGALGIRAYMVIKMRPIGIVPVVTHPKTESEKSCGLLMVLYRH